MGSGEGPVYEALEKMIDYEWPGNIRELENMISRLIVTNDKLKISIEDLPEKIINSIPTVNSNDLILDDNYKTAVEHSLILFEKNYLNYHLKKNNYNISKTAEAISLSRVSLHKKIKELNIDMS